MGAAARPLAAGSRRPCRRPVARAGRSRHRQDHDHRRVGRRTDRARRRPGERSRPDVRPQGVGRGPRAGHLAAVRRDPRAAGPHVPLLRVRAAAPGGRAARPADATAAHRCGADVRVRELLAGRTDRWPSAMRAAVETSGFARELRDLVLRAYERGLDARRPAPPRRRARPPGVGRAGEFMAEYADVTALGDPSAYDPAELIRAVVDMWRADPDALAAERAARPGLRRRAAGHRPGPGRAAVACSSGGGGDLVAVGDPDQSIYGFRGADPRAVDDFPDGSGTPTAAGRCLALHTSRRSGSRLLPAAGWCPGGWGLWSAVAPPP